LVTLARVEIVECVEGLERRGPGSGIGIGLRRLLGLGRRRLDGAPALQSGVVGLARRGVAERSVGDLDALADRLHVAFLEDRIAGQRVVDISRLGHPVGPLDLLERGAAAHLERFVVVLLGERFHADPSVAGFESSLRAMRFR
jgi:hypothetical protein